MKLSILIENYNYGKFIGDAIRSALAIVWDDKEVLVLDDGSTDESWSIIESFGNAIICQKLPNGGQNKCLNIALEMISGDVLIVLDSDDVLLPTVAQSISRVWTSQTTKVQYPLTRASFDLKKMGSPWPHYMSHHTPEYFRNKLRVSGTCEFSLSSGNAWSVAFLRSVTPIPTRSEGLASGFDQYLSRIAPLFGDVITLTDPLGYYRVHDANMSAIGAFSLTAIERSVNREIIYQKEINNILAKHGIDPLPENTSEPLLMGKILLKKFTPQSDTNHTTWPATLLKYFRAVFETDCSFLKKLLTCIWAVAIFLSPFHIAHFIASKRGRSNRKFL